MATYIRKFDDKTTLQVRLNEEKISNEPGAQPKVQVKVSLLDAKNHVVDSPAHYSETAKGAWKEVQPALEKAAGSQAYQFSFNTRDNKEQFPEGYFLRNTDETKLAASLTAGLGFEVVDVKAIKLSSTESTVLGMLETGGFAVEDQLALLERVTAHVRAKQARTLSVA